MLMLLLLRLVLLLLRLQTFAHFTKTKSSQHISSKHVNMYQSQEPKHGFVVPNLLMPFVAAAVALGVALAVANFGTFHKVKIQV